MVSFFLGLLGARNHVAYSEAGLSDVWCPFGVTPYTQSYEALKENSIKASSMRLGLPSSPLMLRYPLSYSNDFQHCCLPLAFFLLLSYFPLSADSLAPLLLNYALLFPQPGELTAEALFPTWFCIPTMCYNLFWVLFAANMLTQLQFCFHILIG